MEDILSVYHLAYDPKYPLLCMDESSKQLVDEVKIPLAAAPAKPLRYDHEYVRKGVANIFLFVEPLTGWRHLTVTQTRTRKDWALQIRELLTEHYPEAKKVKLVMVNLNTHSMSSLYETFAAPEARALAERLEIHYTPKHGSWLNIAEIEFSAMNSQCLDRRIGQIETMKSELSAWEEDRNRRHTKVQWRFTTDDARVKLRKLYPIL